MSVAEMNASSLLDKMKTLPEDVQVKLGYMIEGGSAAGHQPDEHGRPAEECVREEKKRITLKLKSKPSKRTFREG